MPGKGSITELQPQLVLSWAVRRVVATIVDVMPAQCKGWECGMTVLTGALSVSETLPDIRTYRCGRRGAGLEVLFVFQENVRRTSSSKSYFKPSSEAHVEERT